MKRLFTFLFCIASSIYYAQDGLEGVIVERYYTSTEADNAGKLISGELPAGSVTYRIYVDLKPGFRFQAAYGSPEHELFIESTQPIFNHADAGTTNAHVFPERALKKDIGLLDSWLSVGGASENHWGVMLSNDSMSHDPSITIQEGFLNGKTKGNKYSLHERNGLSRIGVAPFPTFFQIDSSLVVLGSATKGNKFSIKNGAWAAMGKGSVGVDSLTTNTVLIAQITTAGDLKFELNLLIGAPNGTSQKYVAKNPTFGEWVHPDLIFDSTKKNKKKKNKSKKRK
jgi:hypothetical protein